ERGALADVPAEVVVEQPEVLAEVVAIGFREKRDAGIEHHQVLQRALAGKATLGLPALIDAHPHGEEIVGDLGGAGDPIPQPGSHGVKPLVEALGDGGRIAWWRGEEEPIEGRDLHLGRKYSIELSSSGS